METLISLHETASRIVWNINKCRKYQIDSFHSIQIAKQAHSPEAEKSANEALRIFKQCEQRFIERYNKTLNKINKLSV